MEHSILLRALLLCRAAEGPVEPTRLSEEEGRDTENRQTRAQCTQNLGFFPSHSSISGYQRRTPRGGRETSRILSESKVKEVKEGRKEGKGGRKEAGA